MARLELGDFGPGAAAQMTQVCSVRPDWRIPV